MKTCPRCEEQVKKLTNPFSDDLWHILIKLQELPDMESITPICKRCFLELRDVLVESSNNE